jgi:hypothetical protein
LSGRRIEPSAALGVDRLNDVEGYLIRNRCAADAVAMRKKATRGVAAGDAGKMRGFSRSPTWK